MLLPPALGFSPHPPVSVYGTGILYTIAAFLGTWLTRFATILRYTSRSALKEGFAFLSTATLVPVFPFPAHAFPVRPHSSDIR